MRNNKKDKEPQKRIDPFRSQKSNRKRARTVTSALAVVTVLSILLAGRLGELKTLLGLDSLYEKAQESRCAVIFPDSGSAGCAVICTGEHRILIDCGREKAQTDPVEILDMLGTQTIDLAVLTHPDSDHIGCYKPVAERCDISTFLTCEYAKNESSPLYRELVETLEAHNVPLVYAPPDDVFTFGETTLEVLSPTRLYDSSNDNSVVLRLECGGFTALFPGDISSKVERDILESGKNVSADLLYVPHHGSSSSTSDDFLNAVSPQYAVISIEQDRYRPSESTIAKLSDFGCEIFRTDRSGTLAILYDGNQITVVETKKH